MRLVRTISWFSGGTYNVSRDVNAIDRLWFIRSPIEAAGSVDYEPSWAAGNDTIGRRERSADGTIIRLASSKTWEWATPGSGGSCFFHNGYSWCKMPTWTLSERLSARYTASRRNQEPVLTTS